MDGTLTETYFQTGGVWEVMVVPATVYTEADASLDPIRWATIAIIGYGNQGRAQARNLRDSGLDVIVATRRDGSWEQAEADGFDVFTASVAAARADVVFLLVPDEVMPTVYDEVEPNLEAGDVVNFASGYNITYDFIEPKADLDVTLVAPRMIGALVRDLYVDGRGAPALLAVHQDATGQAFERAAALAKGIGATRSGAIEVDFETETTTDLMSEQGLFPIFAAALLARYEVETAAGVPPEVTLLESYLSREMAYIFEKAATEGIMEQMTLHSRTSQFGQLLGIDAFDREPLEEFLQERLDAIQSGAFAEEWDAEKEAGYPRFEALRERVRDDPMIQTEQAAIDTFGFRDVE